MNSMLREIVVYIISRFPRGVGRTRLMKLLFLVDAMASKELGHSITGVEWVRWRYGPFSRDVLGALDELVDEGLLTIDPGPEVRYKALVDEVKLPRDAIRIVDKVVEEYGFLPLEKLLEKVYSEYDIDRLGMGEKIALDWWREIFELAERSGSDEQALAELIGRLYEAYRNALEALPSDTLLLYGIAASHLARRNPERLRGLTRMLLEVLGSIEAHIKGDERTPISPELRRRIIALYKELVNAAAEAMGGRE